MALLLAMFQKMRLVREKNQATYQLATKSSKLSRVTKNIERVQKMYTSRISNLESQAKRMQNAASIFFQNKFNFGTNSFSPYNYSGMNGFIQNAMYGILVTNGGYKVDENDENKTGLDDSTFKKYMGEYMAKGSGFAYTTNEKGEKEIAEGFDEKEVKVFMAAMQTAQQMQSMQQAQCQQVTQQVQDNISIWLEAQKEILEAQQDEALLPLNEEETMLELEKTSLEERLTRIKAELESYTQLVSEEAKDSAPKFGL